jgi:hypothetical protein
MTSAAGIVRRHRLEFVFMLGVAVCVAALSFALGSNGWMHASIAVLAASALLDLGIAMRIEGPTDRATLRRELELMRWAPITHAAPMILATLLYCEGASRMVGEHTPQPILAVVLAVGLAAVIANRIAIRQLECGVAVADTKSARME